MGKNKEKSDIPGQSRSVRRTKTALRNSLLELMKIRPILRISVKEICDAADVGRSTFYAHYKDQYDLLREMEDEIFAYFTDMLKKYKDEHIKKETIQIFEEILTYIANNNTAIQVILSENGDITFQKKLLYLFIMNKQIIKYFPKKEQDNEAMMYYFVFMIHGFNGLIHHWLKNNMAMPIPQMAGMMLKCIEQQFKFDLR